MIQITVRYIDYYTDIHFPCAESTLQSALSQLHVPEEQGELFVSDVEYPKEFHFLKDRFVNLDELNFLAKRMESFWGNEVVQFYEAMKWEEFTELKDLINLTLNLHRYTLIQNVGNMAEIGREYTLNTQGCIPADDWNEPKYAELGRKLLTSGEGIFTEHGLLFVDTQTPFEDAYDGQVFPPYLYDSSLLLTATMEFSGRKEYVYLPCEDLAITKAVKRLGAATAEETEITLEDFHVDHAGWFEKLKRLCGEDGLYVVNRLSHVLNTADMDLDKLSAIVQYAGAEHGEEIVKLAENMRLFLYMADATDYEDIGRYFFYTKYECELDSEMSDYFDFDRFGRAITENREGSFLEDVGYVCMEDGHCLSEILDTDAPIKMGGM